MALNIANQRVENKAILASQIIKGNKTAAVEIALDYYLAHHKFDQKKQLTNLEVNNLLDELVSLPVRDERSADEILGYDEKGQV